MLAPDPAPAGPLPGARTATPAMPRAPSAGPAVAGTAEPEASGAAPAFELLADPAAVLAADADSKAARPAAARGKAPPLAREPAPADAVPAASPAIPPLPTVGPLPVVPVASPPPQGAPGGTGVAMPAGIVPAAAVPMPPAANAPALPTSVAEPEAGSLPGGGPAPEASKGGRLARPVEAGAALPALRAEAPAPSPVDPGGLVSSPPLAALPAAAGWQLGPVAAASVEAGRAAAPVAPEAVLSQVTVAVARSGGAARKVELRLDPPELGRVEIHLAPTERGALHATVVAERPETHELLRRHGEVLARELVAAGYSDVTLSFSSGGGAMERGPLARPPELRDAGFVLVVEDGAPVAEPQRPRAPAGGGLDIRL